MKHAIAWHPKAYRMPCELPRAIAARLLAKLDMVAESPFRYLEHYEEKCGYKLRIGAYRFLVDVDFQNRVLLIQHFDKRNRIYK